MLQGDALGSRGCPAPAFVASFATESALSKAEGAERWTFPIAEVR